MAFVHELQIPQSRHPVYASLDLARVRATAAYPIVVDGRNLLDPDAAEAVGLTYLPVGRPARRNERA